MPAHAISAAVAVLETASTADDPSELAAVLPSATHEDWRDQALCTLADPDLWFPEPGASPRTAKLICGWCPAREKCLAWALDTREPYGIYGGLTPLERHAVLLRGAADADAEPSGQVA